MIFKIALRLRDRHFFYDNHWKLWTYSILSLTLKQIFWKTKTFFKKLKCGFLVESSENDSASFSYKTALPKTNVKINRMGSSERTRQKEQSFASSYFIFLKIFFQYWNFLQRVALMYQLPKSPCSYFLYALELKFKGSFSLSVSLRSQAQLSCSERRSFCKNHDRSK